MTAVPLDGDRLDALERLAEKAEGVTDGVWRLGRGADCLEFGESGYHTSWTHQIDEFIAATDPPTVLALVAALRASWAKVERLTVALAAQIGLYRSAEQDVTRLENAMSETDHLEVPVGSIVAYPNGTPWMLRQDGWYVGDAKQPNAALELIGVVLLRRGWTG